MSDSPATVEVADEATPELVDAIAALVPQLSSTSPPGREEIESILAHGGVTLFVAYDRDRSILGMLSLATFPIPTGVRAWIEDVVVDERSRGLGVASLLVEAACELAKAKGARSVDLTSRPSREAANRLYRHLGFAHRETNVYRRALED